LIAACRAAGQELPHRQLLPPTASARRTVDVHPVMTVSAWMLAAGRFGDL
jgi:hypothetical protein